MIIASRAGGRAVPRHKVWTQAPIRRGYSSRDELHAVDALYQQRTSNKTIICNLSHSPLWRV
jgi:hypothetical protein